MNEVVVLDDYTKDLDDAVAIDHFCCLFVGSRNGADGKLVVKFLKHDQFLLERCWKDRKTKK